MILFFALIVFSSVIGQAASNGLPAVDAWNALS